MQRKQGGERAGTIRRLWLALRLAYARWMRKRPCTLCGKPSGTNRKCAECEYHAHMDRAAP
ncbi:hypothetical protein GCM10022270_18110 [Terriglobus aquaticus]